MFTEFTNSFLHKLGEPDLNKAEQELKNELPEGGDGCGRHQRINDANDNCDSSEGIEKGH